MTIAMASAVASFTLIGHHENLRVYGPERYNFMDFVKVETPLTVICWVIVVLLAPYDRARIIETQESLEMKPVCIKCGQAAT